MTWKYYTRLVNIWWSELSSYNKTISHNAITVLVLRPTFGILEWSVQEIHSIGYKTHKILITTGKWPPILSTNLPIIYEMNSMTTFRLTTDNLYFENVLLLLQQNIAAIFNTSLGIYKFLLHASIWTSFFLFSPS